MSSSHWRLDPQLQYKYSNCRSTAPAPYRAQSRPPLTLITRKRIGPLGTITLQHKPGILAPLHVRADVLGGVRTDEFVRVATTEDTFHGVCALFEESAGGEVLKVPSRSVSPAASESSLRMRSKPLVGWPSPTSRHCQRETPIVCSSTHLLRMASTNSLGIAPLMCTTPLSSNSRRISSSVAVAGRGFSHPSDSGEMDPVFPSSLSSESFHSELTACQRGAAKYMYSTVRPVARI